jgi:hypothetical protein
MKINKVFALIVLAMCLTIAVSNPVIIKAPETIGHVHLKVNHNGDSIGVLAIMRSMFQMMHLPAF